MAHTPGPWKIDARIYDYRRGLVGHFAYREVGSDRALFWLARVQTFEPSVIDGLAPECAANANLIAAAPDLLEACRYMHKLLVDKAHGGLAGAILGGNAIAKAEGRQWPPL